uniref:C2H2-type domain-containing protein n=1 Tax=Leptobrachium leishanense TaxID=445787 RepID=A0A8C5MQK3_9ANUR
MNKDKARDPLTQKIMDLTLEIIFLLTGEGHMVVKILEMVTDNSHHRISEVGYHRSQSFNTEPPPHSGIHQQNNEKILELTKKIIQMLTGEVPIRCEDVTVYLSMEEWEYLEEHRDHYKDIRMEDHQPIFTLGKSVSGESHTPVSCSDFGTEYIPSGGEKYLNKARKGRVESVTSTEAEPLTFKERYFPEKDIYPNAEYSPIDIKEEPDSSEEENLTDAELYKPTENPLTQYTGTGAESDSHREGNILNPDIYSSPEHTQTEYPSTDIKKESPTWKDGIVTCKEIYTPPRQTPAECTPDKSEEYLKGNTNLMEINPSESLIESIKPNQSLYSTSLVIYDPVYAGNSVPPSEMGNISTFESDLVKNETHCREEPISSTASGEISTTESASKYQNVYTEEQFSCPECEKHFTNTFALKKHQRIHKRKRQFKCPECGKCFDCPSGLARHKMVHTGDKPFKCLECGKCFIQASNLAAHKMIHTGEKTFICTECGKSFSRSSNLAAHKMIHTGVKPFNCSECEKGFTAASHLAIHKRIHTGEKPFKCTECGNCFAQASTLTKHKRTHTREKQLKCAECGKSCGRASTLNPFTTK